MSEHYSDAVMDHAFKYLDQMLDLEEGLENEIGGKALCFDTTPDHYQPGGLLHRFPSDQAIEMFCIENYLERSIVSNTGRVTAWCSYARKRVHIGWTN